MINIKLEYIITSIGLLGALLISYKTYNYTKDHFISIYEIEYKEPLQKNIENPTIEIEDKEELITIDNDNLTNSYNNLDDNLSKKDNPNDNTNDNPIIMMASI
jgi:hypothetical protein